MLVNQKTFNLKSKITDDWGGSHRVIFDLEALSNAKDWKIGVSIPKNYKIDQIYGARLLNENGQTYISGEDHNKNLDKGGKAEIVLIVDEGKSGSAAPVLPQLFFADSGNSNSTKSNSVVNADNQLNLESKITDDWGGSHRVVLDLEAVATAKDWKIEVALPQDYRIDQIYGAKIFNENGQTFISGKGSNKNLNKGKKAEIVLIVDEGNSGSSAPIPLELSVNGADSGNNSVTQETEKSGSAIDFESKIVKDWNGGYKLELELTAESSLKGWEVDFTLPYTIKEAYGVNLTNRGDGNYTISGKNGWSNLQQGQSIKPILIVDDDGRIAIAPEATSFDSNTVTKTKDVTTNKRVTNNNNLVAQPDGNGKIISVDNNFGGNLEKAIAAANDGDVVKLGNNTYYTYGIKIDKDITIDGQDGSVINGRGTSNSIIHLTSGASGTTIQDVEITNGNNGIFGSSASNLTLRNLEIHNIGINQVNRDGQNNTGINLNHAEGLQLSNSKIYNVSRKGVSVGDTDGGMISGLRITDVNLAAQHAQSHDAAGIKFFNTNDITLKDSYFSDINAFHIWNDTTNGTRIENNVVRRAGEDFLAPSFNKNVDMSGIYNEKSSNAIIKNNDAQSVGRFIAFKATEFSTESMTLINNQFSSTELGSTDYWVNEAAEKLIAVTEDPDAANFSLFADEYYAQANIG